MKLLRLSLLALLFIVAKPSQASHVLGSHFQFEFVSADSTNQSKIFKVSLYLYRDPNGITMPAQAAVNFFKLPSGSTYNLTLNQDTTWSETVGCGSTGSVEIYKYTSNFTADFNGAYIFRYTNCCRSNIIDNLASASAAGMHAYGTLVAGKPVRGTNSSPAGNYAPRSIPIGGPMTFPICYPDPDGDSLSYVVRNSREGTSYPPTDVAFATGYSTSAPFGPNGSLTLDTVAGTITVQSSIQQVCALNMEIIEWAKDTAGIWRVMGKTEHDQLFHFTAPTTPVGSANMLSADVPNTLPSDSIWVDLDFNAFPNMLDIDSVQFQLFHQSSQAYVVAASIPGSPKKLLLRTDVPLAVGAWSLVAGYSSDSVVLQGTCGAPLMDTADFRVEVPVSQIVFSGPDSAYVTNKSYYWFDSGAQWVDSVQYTVTNGFLWNPTTNPNDTLEITWTLPPASLEAVAYVGDTTLNFNINVGVYGIGLEERAFSRLTIAPNPAKDQIQMSGFAGEASYELHNSVGQKVLIGNASEGHIVDLRSIPVGTYILHLYQNGEHAHSVVVKQ